MYNIESNCFKIEPKNRKILSNIYKPNIKKSSSKIKNKNQSNKGKENIEIKRKDITGQIYKRNNEKTKEITKKKGDNTNNNNFEVYNSQLSINSSNTYINNNNK